MDENFTKEELAEAQRHIDEETTEAVEAVLSKGQDFDNVKHMKWVVYAVARWLRGEE